MPFITRSGADIAVPEVRSAHALFVCVCGVIDSLMLNVHRRREREGGRVVVVVGEVCVRGWGSEGGVGGVGWGG